MGSIFEHRSLRTSNTFSKQGSVLVSVLEVTIKFNVTVTSTDTEIRKLLSRQRQGQLSK